MISGCGVDDVRGGVRRWWRRWCGGGEGGRQMFNADVSREERWGGKIRDRKESGKEK